MTTESSTAEPAGQLRPRPDLGRSDRIAELLDDMSVDDLRRATLQAIDHAYKSAAEVADTKATLDGAMGTIAALRAENDHLRAQLTHRWLPPAVQGSTRSVRTNVARSKQWAQRQVGR